MSPTDPTEFYRTRIAGGAPTPEDCRTMAALLWEAHAKAVFLRAYAKLRNADEAGEVCQDTFVRAIARRQEQAGRPVPTVNFAAHLDRIASRLVIDRLRERWKVRVVRTGRLHNDDEPELDLPDPRAGRPDEIVGEQEALDALRRCIEQLTERDRRAIEMVDLNGESYERVVEVLGLPLGTVGTILARARRWLRRCVEARLAPAPA